MVEKGNETLVPRYGLHWERAKMFRVAPDGRVFWLKDAWPSKEGIQSPQSEWPDEEKRPALEEAEGVYVLFRGVRPLYVGQGHIGSRIHNHCRDWLAPWWDNVSWFEVSIPSGIDRKDWIEVIEMILIQGGVGLWNGAEPQKHFGRQRFIGDLTKNVNSLSLSELWKPPLPTHSF